LLLRNNRFKFRFIYKIHIDKKHLLEYTLQKKFINSDFINPKIKKAESIIIKENSNPSLITRGKEKENIIIEIPIVAIINISVINQKQYRNTDRKRLKIIRINIIDKQIEEFVNEIRKLKEKDNFKLKFKICSKCNVKYDYKMLYCGICSIKLPFACIQCENENFSESLICNKCLLRLIEIENLDN
jgi:hypothetical protein